MNLSKLALALSACLLLAQTAAAQWPAYEEKGVPRKADGTVDMDAPAPRDAQGHTDLSGLWDRAGGGGGFGGGRPAQPRTPADGPPPGNFANVGAGIEGGLPFQPLAAQLRQERMSNNQKNNPDALCLPMGLTQLHFHPQPRKMVQTPGVILMMYEGNEGLRQIFTDGRKLPELNEDLQPWWYGYSVGHWEGDELVVETVGFRDDVWLDIQGSPMTSKGRMIERYRRPNYGTLQIDVTIDDPTAYTKPFTFRVNQRLAPDQELIEFICLENEKSIRHYDR
jgi:hypothetical protein